MHDGVRAPAALPDARPLLRGVIHALAFFLAIPAVYFLLQHSPSPLAARCLALYGASLLVLLATSAVYHRVLWSPAARARMRMIDHSAIFVLIAGTYTPICLLAIGGRLGTALCATIWAGATLGIAQTLFWPQAPRVLHVGIYVLLGWAGVFGLASEVRHLGLTGTLFHVVGGILYTLGALAYARKRPNPWPRVFGYHEIYHLLVVVACAALFEVVRRSAQLSAVPSLIGIGIGIG
jgi:hemolysin III